MRYLLCLLPPLAVLSCKKPGQFILSCILTLLIYIPGVIHAILVVNQYNADKRNEKLIKAIRESK
ncbi:YqaE/Pmp3 family membrane protein [Metasolibacillus meyeri]|uniref:YqaE/Pmp3 family membrane protein n=1 Tax=Metasolibacillus meyeri TaxID=1071052 RepID=A0AAW9NIL4_9BACL|nr:YqaE/Pmp3 family membrane protein [Metasolibacillus meyeri]MEC1177617.1 YqaE/Pmp3 family membrane protein [Metasolibacillus meyeri]